MQSRIKSFKYAFVGILHLLRTQDNARIQILAAVVIGAAGFYLGITKIEWCFIFFAISMVWTAEALNPALEFMGNAVSASQNGLIGKAKDVSAAAVLFAVIGAAAAEIIVFGLHILALVKSK